MESKDILSRRGVTPSLTRLKIYEYLQDASHPTVDEIFQALKEEIPTLSKTTVYNTLHLFMEKDLATALFTDFTKRRYDIMDVPHAHFHCTECDEIHDIFDMTPPEIEEDAVEGFLSKEAQLTIKGVCPSCRRQKQ